MIRIIGGTLKGVQLHCPPPSFTRPTKNQTREAVFNILHHRFHIFDHPIHVLDAFAGSGALGLEALSRGAQHIYFIEKHHPPLMCLKKNIEGVKGENQTTIFKKDIAQCKVYPVDLIFCDPPYGKYSLQNTLSVLQGWMHEETLFVWECPKEDTPASLNSFTKINERIYGQTSVSFWKKSK